MAKEMFCSSCGYEGKGKKETPGHILIEIILWFAFLVPGIIYSIWRVSNKFFICPKCKNKSLIPSDSPIALQHKKALTK